MQLDSATPVGCASNLGLAPNKGRQTSERRNARMLEMRLLFVWPRPNAKNTRNNQTHSEVCGHR
jgi:hypothetical protein